MGVVKGVGHVARYPQRVVEREPVFPSEPLAEGLALDVGHREPEMPSRLARIVNRKDVGVLEPRGEADLPLEALRCERHGRSG
jgi:hypothetical protein